MVILNLFVRSSFDDCIIFRDATPFSLTTHFDGRQAPSTRQRITLIARKSFYSTESIERIEAQRLYIYIYIYIYIVHICLSKYLPFKKSVNSLVL